MSKILKPGQKRTKQANVADLFQKPVKAKRIEGPEVCSSAYAEKIELSPSPPCRCPDKSSNCLRRHPEKTLTHLPPDGGWGKKTSMDVICDLIWIVP